MSGADDNKNDVKMIEPQGISQSNAYFKNMNEYKILYDQSINDNDGFWGKMAREHLTWFRPFTKVSHGSFEAGDIAWFIDGEINVSYNCLDRHVFDENKADKTAIIWEGNSPDETKHITYRELLRDVCRFSNVLKSLGVRRGDAVCIYMPMIPEAAVAMLACARIGAPHSVVFAGFSADALRDRIIDGNCNYVITANVGLRGAKTIPLKTTVDHALNECPDVKNCIVYQRTDAECAFKEGRDIWWHEAMNNARPYCPPENMNSEDILFMLFTSGSTGKPKGIAHTQAGYLLYTMLTTKWTFDVHDDDVFACVADVGWITGHSYVLYGPLASGYTTLMFESTPLYPDAGRYWDMVERHKITQFYTAPTAIRALMKYGEDFVKKYDRSSLRVLGTVGEPINPEAWLWYYNVVGDGKRSIVDTYWQTETGGHMLTSLPGATPMKPGSATFPFFGIEPILVDDQGVKIEGNDVSGILCMGRPWPSMARTIYGNHQRYLNTYMTAYSGRYFTGDGAIRDKDGYYWVTGRVDDVINVSGHRMGTAEIESALVTHEFVAEAAVIGVPHDIKGQALFCYVTLNNGVKESPDIIPQLKLIVREGIGAFASPDYICLTPNLPKTRSGKIMRRLLRKIACHESSPQQLGDTSTLADASVLDDLIKRVERMGKK